MRKILRVYCAMSFVCICATCENENVFRLCQQSFYLGMKKKVKIIIFYYLNKTFSVLEAYLKSILSEF